MAALAGCQSHAPAGRDTAGSVDQAGTADQAVLSAEASIRRGEYEQALAEFERAIEVNPRLTTAHMGMADIYRVKGDYAAAQKGYSRAADIEPRNFDAQYYNGLMLHLLNRLAEAAQAYLRALAVKPNDFQANLSLGMAYYQLDEVPQALVYARRAVELDPRSGPARFSLGAVYAARNDHGAAVREYQQAAEYMELSPELLMNLSDSLGKLGRYDEMRSTLGQLLRKEQSSAACERAAFADFKLARYDEALTGFRRALSIDRDYFPALNGVGVCLLNQYIASDSKDVAARDEAVRNLRRSLQLNKDQPQIVELITRYGR